MKSRDFAFWLQGFFELGGADAGLSATQVAVIKQHLGLVFQHDPDIAAKPHGLVPIPRPGETGGSADLSKLMIC